MEKQIIANIVNLHMDLHGVNNIDLESIEKDVLNKFKYKKFYNPNEPLTNTPHPDVEIDEYYIREQIKIEITERLTK